MPPPKKMKPSASRAARSKAASLDPPRILPEGLVLDVVPADPDPEAKPTAREEVNIGRLARHERRLALRKDEDPGSKADPLGDAG